MQPAPRSSSPRAAAATHDRRRHALNCAHPAAALRAGVNRRKALQLRLARRSFRQIGEALGVTASTAHGYVQTAWSTLNAQTDRLRRQLRDQELARLDALYTHYLPLATRDHLRILDPERGLEGPVEIKLADFEEQMHALDQVLKIMTRRALLLGLISPEALAAYEVDDEPQEPKGPGSRSSENPQA